MAPPVLFSYGPCGKCGVRRFDDAHCRCGAGALDPKRAFKFRHVAGDARTGGVLTVRAPGDPVLWQLRCASAQHARRDAPDIVGKLLNRRSPQEAVHRRRVVDDAEMCKGHYVDVADVNLGAYVSIAALMEVVNAG